MNSNVKEEMNYDEDAVLNFIDKTIRENDIVLFMKGTKEAPQCGFSVKAARILELEKVNFLAIDVMSMPGLREEIKKFTNWPTLPQLYCKGRFIGGCDVISDLYAKNLLKEELK
jgi:monothiol glutaredoxin